MKNQAMNDQVRRELEHIPKDRGYLPQGLLRSAYNGLRRHYLSISPSTPPKESLERAIDAVRLGQPEATLRYDQEFF